MKIEIRHRFDSSRILYTGEGSQREVILKAISERTDLSFANLSFADLSSADLSSANLRSANLSSAKRSDGTRWGAPTMALLASWGDVSDSLCADLMLFDAACHPDPTAFDRWVEGGDCPYTGVNVQRAARFRERKELWGKGELCRPYDLFMRLLAEKTILVNE